MGQARTRSRKHAIRRAGFSLAELTVSMGVMIMLMGGLVSAVVVASRAIPDPRSATAATRNGYLTADQIASDLFCATSFSERTATAVAFTVPDRDHGAAGPETIRYAWSGTPGDPLTYEYNGATAADLIPDVYEFDLSYGIETVSETTTQQGTVWTEEDTLASFTSWGGVSPEPREHFLNASYWDSEFFEIAPREGADSLKITGAEVMLRRGTTVPDGVTMAIHRSLKDGTYIPEATPIGTPATIHGSELTLSALWTEVTFADVTIADPARTDYCLVLKGLSTTPSHITHYYNKSAPDDAMYERWTEDGGGSWEPRSNEINQQDLLFYVYGAFSTTGEEEITTERYFLKSVRIVLRAGQEPRTRVETSATILNTLEVTAP